MEDRKEGTTKGFLKVRGALFRGTNNEDDCIWVYILGSTYLWQLPFGS